MHIEEKIRSHALRMSCRKKNSEKKIDQLHAALMPLRCLGANRLDRYKQYYDRDYVASIADSSPEVTTKCGRLASDGGQETCSDRMRSSRRLALPKQSMGYVEHQGATTESSRVSDQFQPVTGAFHAKGSGTIQKL